jgi:putative aldouronate transport system substrate-binding protein
MVSFFGHRIKAGMPLVVVLALLVAATAFGGGKAEPASTTAVGDVAQGKIEVSHFGVLGVPDRKTDVILKLEGMLNVEFEILGAEEADALDKLNIMLASNEMPDVLTVWWNPEVIKRGLAGFTLDEVKQYMPKTYKSLSDIMKFLSMDEAKTWARFSVDGRINQIPNVWYDGKDAHGSVWRKDILDSVGMKVPTTFAEFETVGKAIKAKYPNLYILSGDGKSDGVRSMFDTVFAGTGVVKNDWNLRNGRLVPGWTQPELKQAFELINRWRGLGFIDPEWVLLSEEEYTNAFVNGKYVFIDWVGSYDFDFYEPYSPGSLRSRVVQIMPSAEIVHGPFMRFSPAVMPAIYAWNPFHGGSFGFGKHLNDDRPKLHRVMQMMDQMEQDFDTYVLKMRGLENVHWRYSEDGYVTSIPPYNNWEDRRQVGAGLYWTSNYSFSPISQQKPYLRAEFGEREKQELLIDPDGLYGRNNVKVEIQKTNGDILDENGENLMVKYQDLITRRDIVFVEILTGAKPVSAYDDFVKYWNENGGKVLEEHVNRLFLKNWQ